MDQKFDTIVIGFGKAGKTLAAKLAKQGEKVALIEKDAEKGYTNTKTQSFNGNDGRVHTKVHTYWTQKGRLFIYDLLKSNGIVPMIER